MKYLVIATLALACTRTELGRTVDCREGARVVVNYNEFCIYPGGAAVECPPELPFATQFAEATFCALEENPHPALLAAALEAQRSAADGGVDASGPDASGLEDAGFDAGDAGSDSPDATED